VVEVLDQLDRQVVYLDRHQVVQVELKREQVVIVVL
jgi:hypothetical protein